MPKDPVMLLSYINTQLRDCFCSLDELCRSLDVDKGNLTSALSSIDYHYDKELNKFV